MLHFLQVQIYPPDVSITHPLILLPYIVFFSCLTFVLTFRHYKIIVNTCVLLAVSAECCSLSFKLENRKIYIFPILPSGKF